MPVPDFPDLLGRHMRRIRASAAGVASEIGISREAVNNWRQGYSLPNRKHRDKVLACANYLRLTEQESNELLASAGFEPEFPAEPVPHGIVTSATAQPATVTALFDRLQRLRPYPAMLLLTQAHWGQPPEREAMLAEALLRYGAGRVLHLQPPFSAGPEGEDYFAALGRQCGLAGVDSDYALEIELGRLLQQSPPLFCLVSRFEQGAPAQRDVLAGILRSLSEMHSGQLHLLICGGAALADLKYQGGDLSLLNIAATESWPELTCDDLQQMDARFACDASRAKRALRLSGGHPLLASAALSLLALDDASDADVVAQLAHHPPLWQSLLPLMREPAARTLIVEWLDRPRLAPARPYLFDPLLRQLYWANLLATRRDADGAWLEWRCEAIRNAARMIAASLDTARP
ncbi:MAG: hypothetical protein WBA56_01135 [Stenotrophomonas sp.]